MMEKRPSLTSQDESSNRNPPERCPRPLYSRDSAQITDPRGYQLDGMTVIKVEDDEMFMSDEEEEISPEISTDPGDIHMNGKVVEEEEGQKIKEEELPVEICTVGSSNRNTPKSCHCSLYCQDSTQEHHKILQDDQTEDMIKVVVKEEADDANVSNDDLCKEEEIPPEIRMDGQYQSDVLTRCSKNDKTDETEDDVNASDSSVDNLNFHSKCLSNQSREMFLCSECGKHFTSRDKLIMHQRLHPDEKQLSCLECGKTFKQKSKFAKHQRYHRSQKALPCPECGKCFTQKSLLEIHERVHTGEKPFSCTECGKRFSQSGSLFAHQRIHTSVRPYVCSECGKCFTQRQHLTLHQRTHTAEKPFSCTECGRSFSQRVTLKLHRRTHTGERPFSCSECGKSFTKRPSLVAHQIIHLSDLPFSCSECGKSFTRKGSLTTHQRSHTGEKPFSCAECGKRFTRKTSLTSHMTSHRRQEVLGSVFCS